MAGWIVSFTFPNGQVISQVWGGRHTTSTGIQYIRNESWNGGLSANTSTNVGFIASWSGVNNPPTTISCGAA
jgi:hypothetical protein